ncbi:MAG TPA: hypothetical protein VFW23_15865 [Tepidisphaeraceae bacterium]|nr:hypothetical protein [Tepidisphaeraceae bacterium]
MFKLIKLAIYGLLGYALYEFFRGISTESAARQMQGAGAGGESHNEGEAQSGGGNSRGAKAANAQWSGPGEGQEVKTEEASGVGAPHKVGRGVVSR